MSEEKFLRALGTLYNMAIHNSKGSRAVEICVKDIQNYVQQKENIIKEVRECLNKNRVYIAGERNLSFEIEQILDKENK